LGNGPISKKEVVTITLKEKAVMINGTYRWEWIDSNITKYNDILQEMKGNSSVIRADRKLDYLRQVEGLEQQQNQFKATYKRIQESGDDERDNMQELLKKSWDELEKAFNKVINRYE
jgi:hypothetical protein